MITEKVDFTSPYGRVTWTLPQEAVEALAQATPDVRQKVLQGFGSNITILCGAMLKSFGNPGVVETLNLIMREVCELIEGDTHG